MTYQKIIFLITVITAAVMSLTAFITFMRDKKLAVKGSMRIKEKTLLTMATCFGALGALIGRIVARHKTDKIYFSLIIWLSLVLQISSVIYLGFLAFIR